MPLNTENIEYLVFKFNNGSITPEELRILLDWYNSHDDQQVIIPSKTNEAHEAVKSRILANLLSKVAGNDSRQPVKRQLWTAWMVAAAAVFIVALGIWMTAAYQKPVSNQDQVNNSIEPGSNKATLSLPSGKTIQLSNLQAGIIAGEKITYTNGAPVTNTTPGQPTDEHQLLSLHTPRGGTYKIILPDGSQIWLNAQTTIRYPMQFSAEERIIELEGEAFFQVQPMYGANRKKIPFKVITNRQEVEVLGTQFNLMAYPEQRYAKTTLVEGKVAVTAKKLLFMLAPNEQAITTEGKTMVKHVDVSNYTAWRYGKFSFDGKTFEETMQEIGRWYDLDIIYTGDIPNEELAGDAYRNQNISLVLRLLDVAGIDYQLDIRHRKLTIKGKKNRR